ncbi:hypothetical protein [Kitasatospora kifunensis]|uniref:Uncharacterized protein n=1 Tax=Kitasatospora kifunensis TaxID=58351 RepID=A0A7W7VZQ4_KITKI|nr:hypothetical protein [Kitasatospora kifunensis]MBB4928801.1 hypothetical protein [Kitasatospora kifunensis]
MSRRAAPRRRRAANRSANRTPGSELHRLLSLPARRNLRWPVIVGLVTACGGLYAQVLLTAPPMPPSKAPVPAAGTASGTTTRTVSGTTTAGTVSGTTYRP